MALNVIIILQYSFNTEYESRRDIRCRSSPKGSAWLLHITGDEDVPIERICIKVDHAVVGHLAQLLLEQ